MTSTELHGKNLKTSSLQANLTTRYLTTLTQPQPPQTQGRALSERRMTGLTPARRISTVFNGPIFSTNFSTFATPSCNEGVHHTLSYVVHRKIRTFCSTLVVPRQCVHFLRSEQCELPLLTWASIPQHFQRPPAAMSGTPNVSLSIASYLSDGNFG